MGDIAFGRSNAPLSFVWAYMSNVGNWSDPPATFELNGPFAAGSHGVTRIPGQEPRPWRLSAVTPRQSYVIETNLDRAAMSFEWRFDQLAGGRTRLTQQIILKGENASAFIDQVKQAFESNLAPGMEKIASSIETAATRRT